MTWVSGLVVSVYVFGLVWCVISTSGVDWLCRC